MKLPKLPARLARGSDATVRRRSSGAAGADKSPPAPPLLNWPQFWLTAFTIVILSALMSVNLIPDRVALRLGEVSHREIRANRTVSYFNAVKTEQNRQAAMLNTYPVYDRDERAAASAERIARELFDRIASERSSIGRREPARTAAIDKAIGRLQLSYGAISRAQLQTLLTSSPALLQKTRDIALSRIRMAMSMDIHDRYDQGRPSRDLIHAEEDVNEAARGSLSPENAAIVAEVARLALRPNLLYNARKTEAARDIAARSVPPVYEEISPGEKIIGAGDTVTQEHLDKFTALGLLDPHISLIAGGGVCMLAAAMVLLVVYFIGRTLPALFHDTRRLALLSVIVFISVFGLKVGGTLFGLSFSLFQVGFMGMMTVVAAGMLVSVLLDMQLAVLVVALLAVQSGLIMNHEIRFTVMTLMSSLVGIFTVGHVRAKSNLPFITAVLAITNLVVVWLTGMIQRDTLHELLTGSAWAVGSAAFATFLYWFGILALERPFGILTHTALLELSAADRPLLRELCTVAPGTYAHSMMVGSLAEAGAQAIGADALLCRVGGYYHDIGKMRRPDFFIENQRDGNVHGRLSPSLSALIITAHVRDGVEIALQHRLPKEIRDIIAEHHGTTLIRYFYHQALTDCGGTDEAPPGLEERFRYPGPKPQARESAVVMLADSVEAAARCLHQPSRDSLGRLISGIIRDKMEDGQFDECRLTFREVKLITDAFLHVLTAMMHARIDYPKEFPKNASGMPMELVRADLKPETQGSSPQPQPMAREDVPDPLGVVALGPTVSADALANAEQLINSALSEVRRPPAPSYLPPPRSLLSDEVAYADFGDEPTENAGSDRPAEESGAPAPVQRKSGGRPARRARNADG
ncbi:MAG TPA: HDIG domain-containing protein [Chthonomonadaceae bacterium]|nr:HDIG domain-containing protein [Chthonomonadaceae bacterium]